jgi:putative copper export protein
VHQLLVILHVLGATIWTGGHLVLATAVLPRALRAKDPQIVLDFEAGYEKIGVPALLLQVLTGVWLAYLLLPDLAAWFSLDSYLSTHILAKLALLVATLALALHARLRVVPELDEKSLRALAYHIIPVTVVAVLLAVVGAGLATGGLF